MNLLNMFTEFWLTISFAVVVAATYAPKSLDRLYYSMIWIGYLSASVILLASRAAASSALISRSLEMERAGYKIDIDPVLGSLSSGGIWLLMVLGSIAVVYYVRHVAGRAVSEGT